MNVIGAVFSLGVGLLFLFFGGAVFAAAAAASKQALFVQSFFNMIGGTGVFAALLAGFSFLSALFGFILAYGLWNQKNWARILQSVWSGVGLLSIPIGTILGAVVLWYLWFNEEGKNAFA